MKHQGYFDRALKARDPRFAAIFEKLGYHRTDLVADTPPGAVDLDELRAEYQQLTGKKPYMGWDATMLAAKIAEKRQAA